MNISLEIARKKFKIRRNVLADVFIFSIGYLCYFVLPFGVPIAGYMGLIRNDTEKFSGELSGLLVFYLLLLFMFAVVFFLLAVLEKMRLPIRMKLTDSGSFILMDKKGRQWKIRYANCRYACDFFRCFFGDFCRGTWSRGITIYVPKEYLNEFPRKFGDFKDYPTDLSFHFPVTSENKLEIVSFLENKHCRKVPPLSLNKMLVILFAPTMSLWIHAIAAGLLHKQIGEYGVIGLIVIGMVSGILLACSTVTKPYRKIEYLRNRYTAKLSVYAMIALSIGCPIFLWSTQNKIQPSFWGVVFIALLCYAESYLWIYCLLRHEHRRTG